MSGKVGKSRSPSRQAAPHESGSGVASRTRASTENGNSIVGLQHEAGNQAVSQVLSNKARDGRPLDWATRKHMESSFGEDFGSVRLQTGPEAEQSARTVNAAAFTTGEKIALGTAAPDTGSAQGRRLLAHELAHVVQQRRSGGRHSTGVSSQADGFEKDADHAAEVALAGRPVDITAVGAPPLVQRKPPDDPEKHLSPSEVADEELKRSAEGKKAGKEKTPEKEKAAGKEASEKSGGAHRVQITPQQDELGVKPVNSAEFKKKYDDPSVSVHDEPGLPKAFSSAVQSIDPPHMATGAGKTIADNVDVATDSAKHAMWVTDVRLDWHLRTAGFLDVSVIDSSLLKDYERHERGHELIAKRLQQQLAQRMTAELESVLPTQSKPVIGSGKAWEQSAINAIVNKIETVRKRYEKLFDQLEKKADEAWNIQEKETLSKIASAKKHQQFTPGESAP